MAFIERDRPNRPGCGHRLGDLLVATNPDAAAADEASTAAPFDPTLRNANARCCIPRRPPRFRRAGRPSQISGNCRSFVKNGGRLSPLARSQCSARRSAP